MSADAWEIDYANDIRFDCTKAGLYGRYSLKCTACETILRDADCSERVVFRDRHITACFGNRPAPSERSTEKPGEFAELTNMIVFEG